MGQFLKEDRLVEVGLLVDVPAHAVYEAFVNPHIATHFWFTKSSGG